ncbi:hypothetical protein [Gordonia aurantiaca]|uniref:hypothetical protein n=1 Tax=Gordonia sp. B21 TaxID=3151852 RepID=UPI003266D7BA
MRRGGDSLSILRQDAHAGVEAFVELLGAGRLMGLPGPAEETIRAGLRTVDSFDIAALSADSRALVAAHRAVSGQLHHLPEQRVRLDDGWHSGSAALAIDAVIDHQRRAESDLYVLHKLADATSAAASGIDRLLRSFYLAVSRLGTPIVADTPPAELPEAVLSGRVPPGVVAEDLRSRVELLTTCVEATVRGIGGILAILNRSLDGIDHEEYPECPVLHGSGASGRAGDPAHQSFSAPGSEAAHPAAHADPADVETPGADGISAADATSGAEDVPFRLGGAAAAHDEPAVPPIDTVVSESSVADTVVEVPDAETIAAVTGAGAQIDVPGDPPRSDRGRAAPTTSTTEDPSPRADPSDGDLALAGDQ